MGILRMTATEVAYVAMPSEAGEQDPFHNAVYVSWDALAPELLQLLWRNSRKTAEAANDIAIQMELVANVVATGGRQEVTVRRNDARTGVRVEVSRHPIVPSIPSTTAPTSGRTPMTHIR